MAMGFMATEATEKVVVGPDLFPVNAVPVTQVIVATSLVGVEAAAQVFVGGITWRPRRILLTDTDTRRAGGSHIVCRS
jgi:hypothetical protein